MKTVKYTEEQRKERRATRNKMYYTKNKEFWTEYNGSTYSIYILSGFVNDMVWVGVTRTFKRHLAEHKKTFGDAIQAEILFTIDKDLTAENQNDLLALLARRFAPRCLNAVKTNDVDFSQVEERLKPILSELSEENRNTLKIDCVLPA